MIKKAISRIVLYTLLAVLLGAFWNFIMIKKFDQSFIKSGVVHGFIIGLFLSSYFVFSKYYLRSYFRTLPFWIPTIINAVIYTFLILFSRAFAKFVYNKENFILLNWEEEYFSNSIIFIFFGLLVFIFLNQMIKLIGKKELWNLMVGRYSNSKNVNLIIMFLDLKSSTQIAEKIGDTKFMSLLSEFFYFMDQVLENNNGRIYKYVGDEAIIFWEKGETNATDSIDFYLAFKNKLISKEAYFQKKYNVVPSFKAGLHFGKVIIGEIGNSKKEIALVGDSLNTTARILKVGKEENKDLLVSESLADILVKTDKVYQVSFLGEYNLTGKEKMAKLYEIVN